MKTILILNPKAANGKAVDEFPQIFDFLKSENISYDFKYTKSRGHAEKLAKEAVEAGYEKIIVVGGDGTLNETVNGMMKANGSAVLGILPIGTCNDFIKSIGVPHDLDDALKIALNGSVKAFDVGQVGDRFFINVIGVGFDVDIVQEMQQTTGKNSFAKYMATVMKHILFYKGLPLSIKSSQFEVNENILLLAIANGTSFGGNFNIAPQADPCDGLFELVLVRNVKPLMRFAVLSRVINGTHGQSKHVEIIQTKELEITSKTELVFQVEGEIVKTGRKNVKISNIPGGIELIVKETT